MKSLSDTIRKLRRLADTLGELKERVRDAIAGELSRVVAQTVQDILRSFVRGRSEPPPPENRREPSDWRDDHDPWADEQEDHFPPARYEPEPEEIDPPPAPVNRWHRAFELGTTVLRWWLAGRWKPFVGLGVASLAGAAAWYGGPAIHAGTGVVLAAAELIAFGSSHSLR